MTNVGLWARVSTDDQQSENQIRELREWAARRGFTVAREYVLDGDTASKGEQDAALEEAFADARLGRIEILLLWPLDRVERRGVEATLNVLRRFATAGCPVWSLREPFTETADPRMAELLVSIFAWMAAEESRIRSERTKTGMARARAQGKKIGGRQRGARDLKPRRRTAA